MLEMHEARDRILATASYLGAERVFLGDVCGRILARDVCAVRCDPRFDNSAMDGYAVRWEDVESLWGREGCGESVALRVVGVVAAGCSEKLVVGVGEAVRIMTGAPMPEGADTVVMREDTDESDAECVRICALPQAGQGAHIRSRGENVEVGDVVLQAGERVRAGSVGVLAAFASAGVSVARKARVAILSTGDELVEAGEEPGEGQIVGSSVWALSALIEEAGGVPWRVPIVRDDVDAIRDAFSCAARGADLVVSIGGVSVGDYDLVRVVLDEVCAGMEFWKIRMKPGKPLAFGTHSASHVPWIGLPGNPVSAFVGCHMFVLPWLRKAMGQREVLVETSNARLVAPIRSPSKRLDIQRGTLAWDASEGVWTFDPHRDQRSGNQRSIGTTNAFAYVPIGISSLQVGEWVKVERLYVR